MRPALALLALAGAAAALLAACGGDDGGDGRQDGGGTAGAPLAGTPWRLDTAALGFAGAGEVTATIRFDARGTVAGDDGCNRFTGGYEQDGDALRFGPLARTKRACAGPAGEVAARVGNALPEVARHAIDGATLRLQDAGGATLLTYTEERQEVTGRWDVISVLYDDAIRSVVADTMLTATFGAGGRVSGSSGCNAYEGPYATSADAAIRIGPLAATERACAGPAGANEQEAGFLAALASARRFERAGPRLTLLDARGRMAVVLALAP